MKILVVHDRSEIASQIRDVVVGVSAAAAIDIVEDAVGARDKLTEDYFDLMIIDLTIANVSGRGEVSYQAVEGLLEEVFTPSRIFAPGNIVGITRDPDALKRVSTKIGSHLMSIVREDDEGGWQTELADRISYVQLSQRARSSAWLTKHDYDLFILSALDKELRPLQSIFELSEQRGLPGVFDFVFNDREGRVRRAACAAIGRAGQASAAAEAEGLICQLRPKLAIMVGFCGGVEGKVQLGDILVAETAIDWDFGKWKPNASAAKLYSRPEPITIRGSTTHRIARRLVDGGIGRIDGLQEGLFRRSAKEITSPSIKLTPFASGSAVIADANVLETLRGLNEDIGGVDMESYGFYYASRYSRAARAEFMCIKSVADHCKPDKDDRLHEACCYASAELAHHIVTREWDFS
ncbi:hypothetical protein NKH63_19985 [Mesorhizobium sp. M0960]|uniref:5'-methylthioadenosine/S-adenosylhomocysteine nucleosidase family protein n=1 Tax=Mesorhizobium sp. M0960 TaxID=2957035 RepID=UPI00333608B3